MAPYDPTETRRLTSLHNARLAPPLPDGLLARIAALEKSRPKRTSTDRMREKRARDREEAPPLEPRPLATNSNAIRQRRWRERQKERSLRWRQEVAAAMSEKIATSAPIPVPIALRIANRLAKMMKVIILPSALPVLESIPFGLALARLESLLVGGPDPASDFQPKMPEVLDLG